MHVGAQLVAPQGYANLRPGTVYYFLRSRPKGVLLVEFQERIGSKKKKCGKESKYLATARTYMAVLVRMPRGIYEKGLDSEILLRDMQENLPPWLVGVIPIAKDSIQARDLARRTSHANRAIRRNEIVQPVVARADEILNSHDPDRLLNEYAKACVPRQKEARLRLWFYTKLIFGTLESLFTSTRNIGKWDREREGKKRGRRGGGGYNANPTMIRMMLEGYADFNELGRELTDVYLDVLKVYFGCRTRQKPGQLEIFQPEGHPFPSYSQFHYYVRGDIGEGRLLEDKRGGRMMREEFQYSKGPYVEGVSNLMSQIQSDAYMSADHPRSFLSDEPLPRLCTATQIDVASGEITGVGFSLGSEKGIAYRLAKFCSAIPKVKFCALFGIEIQADEWPSIGLTAADLLDRGPGSGSGANAQGEAPAAIRTLAPAGQPRSKASIESSNPKTPKHGEGPAHARSDHTPIEMAKREIRRIIKHNKSANVAHHVPPDLMRDVPMTVPNALWVALDSRGRNDAVLVSFAQAVRMFLPKVRGFIRDDGVYVMGQRYDSPELRSVVLREVRVGRAQIPVEVYHLNAALRYVWLDVKDKLVELEIHYPLRAGTPQKYISYTDLERRAQLLKENDASVRSNRFAANMEMNEGMSSDTGRIINKPRIVRGRAKTRSPRGRQAAADAKRQVERRS